MSLLLNYKVIATDTFRKQAKRLVRKYPSLIEELSVLSGILSKNPTKGTALGNNTYKIRIAIKSKKSGKSSGARIITFLLFSEEEIYLLAIYDKSDLENISDKQITNIIAGIIDK